MLLALEDIDDIRVSLLSKSNLPQDLISKSWFDTVKETLAQELFFF